MGNEGRKIVFAADTGGHTFGYQTVARGLRDAGFEVVMTGNSRPKQAVEVALQEDADLIAYRIMDRDPVALVRTLSEAMTEAGLDGVPILLGGIINKQDLGTLEAFGVRAIFTPGSKLTDITERAAKLCQEGSS